METSGKSKSTFYIGSMFVRNESLESVRAKYNVESETPFGSELTEVVVRIQSS